MIKTMHIGLVGCGHAAQQLHIPALSKLDSAEIIMGCDVSKENLQEVQNQVPSIIVTSDYKEVIGNPEVDIVAVLTPAFLHTDIAIKAFEAGKHVFIEKPMALTLGDCRKLIRAESDSKGSATVGFNLRFHRLVSKARTLISEGKIGRIESLRSVWTSSMRQSSDVPSWRHKRELGGSALFEVGIHHFDLWKYLIGEAIEEISASAKVSEGIERSVVVNARSKSGVPISALFSDWTADSNEVEIYGDKGVITLAIYRVDGLKHYSLSDYAGGLSTRIKEGKQILAELHEFPKSLSMGGDYKSSYYYEWKNFISNIQKSKSTSPSLEDGYYATQVSLAASESVVSNLPIKVLDSPDQVSLIA